jgi:riboflavin kinase/FMN adenylyltransferase
MGVLDGFDLVVVPPFALDGRSVRSSDVRSAIAAGDFEAAEPLLGRPYAVVGKAAADGTLTFDMPVAQPPPGSYQVTIDGRRASLAVDGSGTMRVMSAGPWSPGARVKVQFAADG